MMEMVMAMSTILIMLMMTNNCDDFTIDIKITKKI